MTKVSIIGQSTLTEKKLKPIVFCKKIEHNGDVLNAQLEAKNWNNVIVLSKGIGKYDIFYAYNDNAAQEGCVYLGHYNDGVVE